MDINARPDNSVENLVSSTDIVNISEDVLESLFEATPKQTVSADNLLGAKDTSKAKPAAAKKEVNMFSEVDDSVSSAIPTLDLGDDEEEDKEDEEDAESKLDLSVKKTEDADADEEKDETGEEKIKSTAKAKKTEKKEEEPAAPEVTTLLKTTVDYLVEKGHWEDFEGRDEIEDLSEEQYGELVAQQDSYRLNKMFSELVDKTGPYGKAIIDFVAKGGNPDSIIDVFKEQKKTAAIDLSTDDGKLDLLETYYKTLGWSDAKVKRTFDRLQDRPKSEIEDEVAEAKELMDKHYASELSKINEEQENYLAEQQEQESKFRSNITNVLDERKDLTMQEKSVIFDQILNYDQKLPNGEVVNKFYLNFAKIQADPKEYVDLVQFVMDKKGFLKKHGLVEQNKATEKAFKFIKNGAALSRKAGSQSMNVKHNSDDTDDFHFGLPKK